MPPTRKAARQITPSPKPKASDARPADRGVIPARCTLKAGDLVVLTTIQPYKMTGEPLWIGWTLADPDNDVPAIRVELRKEDIDAMRTAGHKLNAVEHMELFVDIPVYLAAGQRGRGAARIAEVPYADQAVAV